MITEQDRNAQAALLAADEMVEILKAFGRISDGLEAEIEQAYLNNFILTADAETVKIWEKVLGITYKEKLTLDQRKSVVIGRISGYGHIGEPECGGRLFLPTCGRLDTSR